MSVATLHALRPHLWDVTGAPTARRRAQSVRENADEQGMTVPEYRAFVAAEEARDVPSDAARIADIASGAAYIRAQEEDRRRAAQIAADLAMDRRVAEAVYAALGITPCRLWIDYYGPTHNGSCYVERRDRGRRERLACVSLPDLTVTPL